MHVILSSYASIHEFIQVHFMCLNAHVYTLFDEWLAMSY